MIELKNVTIQYFSYYASLFDFSKKFSKNTILIGKIEQTSAIFRTILNFDKFSGEILIDGINIKNIKNKNYPVAYVPTLPQLFQHKSIFENITYPLKIRKIKKIERKEIFDKFIENFKIDFMSKRVKELNKSEEILISLIRSIIHKPKYILIENIFENIDSNFYDLAKQLIDYATNFSQIIISETDTKFFVDAKFEKIILT